MPHMPLTRELTGITLLLFACVGCAAMKPDYSAMPDRDQDLSNDPPGLLREARGIWVASVANIDWPSKPGLSTQQQQDELISILDRAAELNMNVVVLQVRPAADALYASKLEPWSAYLSGKQGVAPSPLYDPLAFAVEKAHERGLELHAWFNPFRARHPAIKELASNHVYHQNPDWVREYGEYLWLDPTEPAASEHSLNVIADVVQRYDIDGVHVDDYFYPYPVRDDNKEIIPFPDHKNWQRYQASGGPLSRNDWRRSNINEFMQRMYARVKQLKPWVKVGISPFGIWRPKHPPQIQGFDAYENLYADARLWLQEGWLDYFTPQLYWPIEQKAQSYPVLMNWWIEQNARGRAIWPGNYTSRVLPGVGDWPPTEIADQISLTRRASGASGNIHFSAKAVLQSDALAQALRSTYAQPALVPAMPWLAKTRPGIPVVMAERTADGTRLKLRAVDTPAANGWVVAYRMPGGELQYQILPGTTATVEPQIDINDVRVATVDRYGQLSNWVKPG